MAFVTTLARAKHGDAAARDALIEEFYPSVRQMVHRQLKFDLRRNRPWMAALFSTGDIVHEVFLGVLRDLSSFEGSDASAFRGFLATTVAHRLLDTIRYHQAGLRDGRRAQNQGDLTQVEIEGELPSPTHMAVVEEESAAVREALGTMSSRDRSLLELRFRQSVTFPAIARRLGIPTADAARKAVCLAQAKLLVRMRRFAPEQGA